MVKKTAISMDDWIFDEIEKRRGDKGRSEYICELIAKALGFSSPPEEKEATE
jgi:metal-responsive CopG/Arc/MetJ family transcriptional regulator